MSETPEDPKKCAGHRPQAVKICQGDEPPPKDRSDIAFLIRKAQVKKADGDLLVQRAAELEAALLAIQKEILKTQGAIDSFIDLIAELLEDQDKERAETPPQEPAGASTEAPKGPPQG